MALLGDQGIEATQTTVSRDLDDLGAVKVRLPGGETAYALPELPVQQIAPEDHLRRVLGEWVVEVAHSGNLVVLRTPPGSAHVVGLRPRPQRAGRGRGDRGRRRHGAGRRRRAGRWRRHGGAPRATWRALPPRNKIALNGKEED